MLRILWTGLIGLWLAAPGWAALEQTVVARMLGRVVTLEVEKSDWPMTRNRTTASGIIIEVKDGSRGPRITVLTNAHAAPLGCTAILADGRTLGMTRVAYDTDLDIAVLKGNLWDEASSGLPREPLAISGAPKQGQDSYTVGAPRGLAGTLSKGIISAVRKIEGIPYIQTSAPASPGSSGGALFDEAGGLLGMVTFKAEEGEALNFAISAPFLMEAVRASGMLVSEGPALDNGVGATRVMGITVLEMPDWKTEWAKRNPEAAVFEKWLEGEYDDRILRVINEGRSSHERGEAANRAHVAWLLAQFGKFPKSTMIFDEIALHAYATVAILEAAVDLAPEGIKETNKYRVAQARILAGGGRNAAARAIIVTIAKGILPYAEATQPYRELGQKVEPRVEYLGADYCRTMTRIFRDPELDQTLKEVIRAKGYVTSYAPAEKSAGR